MRTIGSSTNADYNLTTLQTVHSVTPDASNAVLVYAHIVIGDGTKNLDGTGGDFEVAVSINGVTVDGGVMTKTLGTEVRAIIQTDAFVVPSNEAVKVKLKSPNAGDTDVDVTCQLYDAGPTQPTTRGRTVDINSTNNIQASLQQILDTNISESTTARIADNWRQFWDNADQSTSSVVDNLDATVSSRSTSDATAANQTTMLSRLTVTRAGYLDFLNIGGNVASQASALTAAQVNAEVDTALSDYDGPTKAEMDAAFTEIKGASWATTDTLEAIRDRGDAAWVTGSGGGDATAANQSTIIAYVDELESRLTSARAANLDNLDATVSSRSTVTVAQVNAEVDTALSDYDGPTKAEVDAAFTEIKGATWSSGTDTLEAIRDRGDSSWITATGFSTLSAADVNAEVDTALSDYDAPTKAEMDAAFTEIKGAGWTSTDTLEAIRDRGDAAWVTATGFNTTTPPTAAAITTAVLTTQMTEDYAALNTAPTLAQAMFEIRAELVEVSTSGTTKTTKKIDGSTTATTSTLNDASNPTSTTRAT